MTETEIKRELVKKFRAANCIAQPIESGGTGVGIPDLFVRTCKTDCWCEIKIADVRSNCVKIKWRPGQLRWLSEYVAHGGRALLIVGIGTVVAVFEYPNFLQWYMGNDFNKLAREMNELSSFEGKQFIEIIDHDFSFLTVLPRIQLHHPQEWR